MAETTIPITPGAGANIEVYQGAIGAQQVIREAPATAIAAPSSWAISTTGVSAQIAADVTRRSVILWNTGGTAIVYLRFDTTIPTTAAGGWHDQIPAGARLEVAKELCTLAISVLGSATSGTLEIALATSA